MILLLYSWGSNFGYECINFISYGIGNINKNVTVFYLIGILLLGLLVCSLLTWVERKVLAACMRRLGPNHNGWVGILQLVADGLKLFIKENVVKGISTNSGRYGVSYKMGFLFGAFWMLTWSCLSLCIIWLEMYGYCSIKYSLYYMFFILSLSHYGFIVVVLLVGNPWSVRAVIRSLFVTIFVDALLIAVIIMSLIVVSDTNSISINSVLPYSSRIISMPMISIVMFIYIIIETGRIPVDLQESESELVAGYCYEFGGISYAMFAAAEYFMTFVHCFVFSVLFVGLYNSVMGIMFGVVFTFSLLVLVRAVVPRIRYNDIRYLAFNGMNVFILVIYVFIIISVVLS